MKIAVILGSPRLESNSGKLAQAAVSALSGRNPEVETFRLNDLRYRGCQGCFGCKTKAAFCVLKDDLARVLSAVAAADLAIVASPVYIGEITAQLKGFIDRSFSWYKPDFKSSSEPSRLDPGKKLIFVLTQGNPDREAYGRALDAYLAYFGSHGFKAVPFVATVGTDDLASAHPGLLEEIAALARDL
ncbi:MAG: flavodoxin family protein [Deltaproteobacteria bacterium]|jgi:multimeric flavodoxin WrbA|nr:flavodoxin family protein [Deltaproteobacteria bacterium]